MSRGKKILELLKPSLPLLCEELGDLNDITIINQTLPLLISPADDPIEKVPASHFTNSSSGKPLSNINCDALIDVTSSGRSIANTNIEVSCDALKVLGVTASKSCLTINPVSAELPPMSPYAEVVEPFTANDITMNTSLTVTSDARSVEDCDAEEPYQSSGSEYLPSESSLYEFNSNERKKLPTQDNISKNKGRKKRGRKRKNGDQSREDRKKFCNTNQRYVTVKNRVVEPKAFNPDFRCECLKKCTEKVDMKAREKLFQQFWGMGSFEGRCVLLNTCVKEIGKKRTYTKKKNSRRSKTRIYFIEDVQVCKETLLKTLQINANRIRIAIDQLKSNNTIKDKRGIKSGGRNAIEQERIEEIVKHISSFPTYVSHYCREQTDSRFLSPDLNLRTMYSLYQEQTENAVSLSKYKDIFYTKFNLRFKTPHKDTCKTCDVYKAQLNCSSHLDREKLENDHKTHLDTAAELREQMNKDLKSSKEDETVQTLTFDLQKTHPLPKLPTGIVYYKRQLNFFNLGIAVGSTGKGIFNVWLEYEAGRGTQEVGSCLRKFIINNIKAPVTKLNLWSDSCGGQNRSIKLVLMLIHILQNHPSLEEIQLKFLLSGHSFLPNDSHFGDVECALKSQQRVYTDQDYINIMRACRNKNKFIVNKITREDIVSVINLERAITNRKVDINKQSISWLKTHEIVLKKDKPYVLFMKNNIKDETYAQVDIEKKTKGRKPNLKEIMLPLLWPNGKPLSSEKIKDLKEIMKLIPQDAKVFYNFLKENQCQEFEEDIEGLGHDLDFEIDDAFLED